MWGADGLHVFARSLTSADAMEGMTVELVSNANEVIGTATTDAMGYASFPAAMTMGQGSAAPALVVAEGENDLVYLSLRGPEFDLSDRGVEGNPAAPPIDVFLTTDRGPTARVRRSTPPRWPVTAWPRRSPVCRSPRS